MEIGEQIKKFRKQRGLTQKQLGERCNLSEAMVRQYELGIRNPKYETLQKIATALETHPLVLKGLISATHAESLMTVVDWNTALLSLIKHIYEDVDEKSVHLEDSGYAYYFKIGDCHALSELDYDNLSEYIRNEIEKYIDSHVVLEGEEIVNCEKALDYVKNWKSSRIEE